MSRLLFLGTGWSSINANQRPLRVRRPARARHRANAMIATRSRLRRWPAACWAASCATTSTGAISNDTFPTAMQSLGRPSSRGHSLRAASDAMAAKAEAWSGIVKSGTHLMDAVPLTRCRCRRLGGPSIGRGPAPTSPSRMRMCCTVARRHRRGHRPDTHRFAERVAAAIQSLICDSAWILRACSGTANLLAAHSPERRRWPSVFH